VLDESATELHSVGNGPRNVRHGGQVVRCHCDYATIATQNRVHGPWDTVKGDWARRLYKALPEP
jgi:hypothetical protein